MIMELWSVLKSVSETEPGHGVVFYMTNVTHTSIARGIDWTMDA